jgi:hypothetical protein
LTIEIGARVTVRAWSELMDLPGTRPRGYGSIPNGRFANPNAGSKDEHEHSAILGTW